MKVQNTKHKVERSSWLQLRNPARRWRPGSGPIAAFALTLFAVTSVLAQSGYLPQGGEYPIAGTLVGDQVFPDASIRTSGGFLVWQDNATDGNGLGISAQRLNSGLSATLGSFRVNSQGAQDQERPRVAMLNDGGAVFVWQGGKQGFQRIYARFLSASNTWVTGDLVVNTFTNSSQIAPAVAVLPSGNVVVAWGSFDQEYPGSLQGVYAQMLSPTGVKISGEFLVNQTSELNQRLPAVSALADGRFVVGWISEQPRPGNNLDVYVDVYARFFGANGTPDSDEFLINTSTNITGHPSIAAGSDGSFLVAWSERDWLSRSNSWDVMARPFTAAGVGGTTRRVNTLTYGDQIAPRVSANGTDYLMVWLSMGQDGSREGVYGQFLRGDGSLAGPEFRVNSTTISQQMHPAVASDKNGRFLTAWASFTGGNASFDLFAQRYASVSQPIPPPDPPFVTVLGSNSLSVTWPIVAGFSVANYEVYADGSATPTATVTNNSWTMTGLAPASTHSFRLAYVLTDGRRSPLSGATTNFTYSTLTWGGIPYDWMIDHFGNDIFSWPAPNSDTDGDGATLRDEFLAGTDPTDASSVLRTRLHHTPQGPFLSWNTQPGLIYQVQSSTSLGTWVNAGSPRFAPGQVDSIYVGGNARAFFRIIRLR